MIMRNYLTLILSILYSILNETFCDYQIIKTLTDVSSSKAACADLGMQQVVIRDEATYNDVVDYLGTEGSNQDIWVGMYWDGGKEVFRWSDNDAIVVESIRWDAYGEPNCMTPWSTPCNGYGGLYQNCVRLMKNTFLFRTTNCDPGTKWYSLCQTKSYDVTATGDRTVNQQVTCEPRPTSNVIINQQVTCEPCPTCNVMTNQQLACEPCPTVAPSLPVLSQSRNLTSFHDSLFKINKKETGLYRRQHTSAYDGRLSSKVIGLTGTTILVIVCSLFLVADMTSLSSYKQELKQRSDHKT